MTANSGSLGLGQEASFVALPTYSAVLTLVCEAFGSSTLSKGSVREPLYCLYVSRRQGLLEIIVL